MKLPRTENAEPYIADEPSDIWCYDNSKEYIDRWFSLWMSNRGPNWTDDPMKNAFIAGYGLGLEDGKQAPINDAYSALKARM